MTRVSTSYVRNLRKLYLVHGQPRVGCGLVAARLYMVLKLLQAGAYETAIALGLSYGYDLEAMYADYKKCLTYK